MTEAWRNRLYYGDNLEVMREHIPSDSVDLVYLDPPFNSNRNYNVIFGEHHAGSVAQIEAFGDTSGDRQSLQGDLSSGDTPVMSR